MAFSVAGDFGGRAISLSAAGSFTFTSQATVTANAGFVVCMVSCQNVVTGSGSTSKVTVSGGGNTWLKAGEFTGAAAFTLNGITTACWYCRPTTTITASSLVVVSISHGTVTIGAAATGITGAVATGNNLTLSAAVVINNPAGTASLSAQTISSVDNVEHLFVWAVGNDATAGSTFSISSSYTKATSRALGTGVGTSIRADMAYRILTGITDIVNGGTGSTPRWTEFYFAFTETTALVTQTLTASLDSILKKTQALTASLDAKIQHQANVATAQLDAIIKKTQTLTTSIDARLLHQGVTKTAVIDAKLLHQNLTAAAQLDAILARTITETAQIDAILKGTVLHLASIDAVIKKTQTLLTSTDAKLQRQGILLTAQIDAVMAHRYTEIVVIDAILQKTLTATAQIDAQITRPSVALTAVIDAAIKHAGIIVQVSIDATIQKMLTQTVNIDALVARTMTLAATFDAALAKMFSVETDLDAILLRHFAPEPAVSGSWSEMAQASSTWAPVVPESDAWSAAAALSQTWSVMPKASTVWH